MRGTRRSFEERLKRFYGQGALLAAIALLSVLGVRRESTSLCWDTLLTFWERLGTLPELISRFWIRARISRGVFLSSCSML